MSQTITPLDTGSNVRCWSMCTSTIVHQDDEPDLEAILKSDCPALQEHTA